MLELYSMGTCPYCDRVKEYLKSHNMKYNEYDVSDPKYATELMKLGGKAQVPFLVEREKNIYLYDSNAIIKYLQEKE